MAAAPEMIAAPEKARQDEFDALYRGHVGDVYRYSLSVVHDPAEAEDVTQTTFLNAYRAYDGPLGKPQAWLLTIARNICFERYRRSLRRPRLVPLHEAAAAVADVHDSVRAEAIFDALQGLPRRQRTALLLDAIDGRSRAEIAQELEIGETTVTGLLMRARGNLRLQLDEGMSCTLAQQLQPRLEGSEVPNTRRRAAMAHLRNCERCAVDETASRRSLSGLLAALIPAMRSVVQPVVGMLPGGAAGFGAAAAVVAAAGTIAWQAAPAVKHDRPVETTPAAVVTPSTARVPEPARTADTRERTPRAPELASTAFLAPAAKTTRSPAPTVTSGPPAAAADAGIAPTADAGSPPGTSGSTDRSAAAGEPGGPAASESTSVATAEPTDATAPAPAQPATGSDAPEPAPAPGETPVAAASTGTPTVRINQGNGGTPPGQARPDNVPPGQAKPDNVPPGQTKPDNVPPGQTKPDNVPPGQTKPDNVPPGHAKAASTPPGQAMVDKTPPAQADKGAAAADPPASTSQVGNGDPNPGQGNQGQGLGSQGTANGVARDNDGQGNAAQASSAHGAVADPSPGQSPGNAGRDQGSPSSPPGGKDDGKTNAEDVGKSNGK